MGVTDWVPYAPFITVFGPIVGALIGASVTLYFAVARKKVGFWIAESEDLTLPLRRQHNNISFRVSGRDFLNLNRSSVFVKSVGNRSIGNLRFDIEIPGEHEVFLGELVAKDPELRKAIVISWDEPQVTNNPRFHVSVSPFLKQKESFEILLYFDRVTSDCKVHCRMEDVQTTTKSGKYTSFVETIRKLPENVPKEVFGMIAVVVMALFVAFTAVRKAEPSKNADDSPTLMR